MIGARIEQLLGKRGMSQSELARRVGLRQSTINGLIAGEQRSTTKLHLIARELGTTAAFLEGETDDPDAGASPPAAPRLQLVTMPVALPTEEALAEAFGAVLQVSAEMSQAELARELAKRLPTLLRIAGGAAAAQSSASAAALDVMPAPRPRARPERQRA